MEDQLCKLEQNIQIKKKRLEQIEHQKQALEDRLKSVRRTDETRLKILMGSYLIKLLKQKSHDVSFLEHQEALLIEYIQLNKNPKVAEKNVQLISEFFEKMNQN